MMMSIAGWVTGVMRSFTRSRKGAASTEYAIIAGFISVAILAAVALLGGTVADLYQRVLDAFG